MGTILTIVATVVATGLVGLFGAWIQGRREHKRWLRERRIDVYLNFLDLIDEAQFNHANRVVGTGQTPADVHPLRSAFAVISLLGPDPLLRAAGVLHGALIAELDDQKGIDGLYIDARDKFIVAARSVIKIDSQDRKLRAFDS